jgi:hypothetical protein
MVWSSSRAARDAERRERGRRGRRGKEERESRRGSAETGEGEHVQRGLGSVLKRTLSLSTALLCLKRSAKMRRKLGGVEKWTQDGGAGGACPGLLID